MQTVEPFSAQVFNDTMLQVSSRFDNSRVTGAYFIQTIGLFAKLGDGDPVLFEVAQAITPDEMPAQSAVAPSAFVYNMQVTIQQASQLTVTVNPAGTATVQDILTLNATKVDIDGGDISNTIAATFEASNASWPIPAAGETLKVILGKIKKHLEDLANWRPTVSLVSDIVNNLTSTATDKPLSANQGKVLQDQITQVNSDLRSRPIMRHGNENTYRFINISFTTLNGVIGFWFSNGKTFVAASINLVFVGESISSSGCVFGTMAGQEIVTNVSAIKNPNSYRVKIDMSEAPNAFDILFLVANIDNISISFSES